jgi:hypothetical protein
MKATPFTTTTVVRVPCVPCGVTAAAHDGSVNAAVAWTVTLNSVLHLQNQTFVVRTV